MFPALRLPSARSDSAERVASRLVLDPDFSEDSSCFQSLWRRSSSGDSVDIIEFVARTRSFDSSARDQMRQQTSLHAASANGNVEAVAILCEEMENLDPEDGKGNTPLIWASRAGHSKVVRLLASRGADVNHQNKVPPAPFTDKMHGASPLHAACRYGLVHVVGCLCDLRADVDVQDEDGDTPLHSAAVRGDMSVVGILVKNKALLDIPDKQGYTPLHLALRRQYSKVALLLLEAGANPEIPDAMGETAMHIASREGLETIAQTLCAFNCPVDQPNKNGNYPLHLAAKFGHIEIIRRLCLHGCDVQQKNRTGITAEVTAYAHGHKKIGELLGRLSNESIRLDYIAQLVSESKSIPRVKLKLFGHSGVGKTTLINTLKTGYFSGFFRRSRSGSGGQSLNFFRPGIGEKEGSMEMHARALKKQESLTFDYYHEAYTRGIDVHQVGLSVLAGRPVSLSGAAGDWSLWEFSGVETYYLVYDHFIGNTCCINAIIFRLTDPLRVQLQQVQFWLRFLKSRLPPAEPLGHCGKSYRPAKIILIGTHVDTAHCQKNQQGEYLDPSVDELMSQVLRGFGRVFDIHPKAILLDANASHAHAIKDLKLYMTGNKAKVLQGLPRSSMFLEACTEALGELRKRSPHFPVLKWREFLDAINEDVNPLAGIEHIMQATQQLQLMGEVVYLVGPTEDLVVLSPRWLGDSIIGRLLSLRFHGKAHVTGSYSLDDFQMTFSHAEAFDMLQLLQAIGLCIQVESGDEDEYEFPCFNLMEAPEDVGKNPTGYKACGFRFLASLDAGPFLVHIFPRLQIGMRRVCQQYATTDESDLAHWCHGSKIYLGDSACALTLVKGENFDCIEVVGRGPSGDAEKNLELLQTVVQMALEVIGDTCPGVSLQWHVLSTADLRDELWIPRAYTSEEIGQGLLNKGPKATYIHPEHKFPEDVADLFFFGDLQMVEKVIWLPDQEASTMHITTKQALCNLLDTPDPQGKDWCLLAVKLGLRESMSKLDCGSDNPAASRSSRILEEWIRLNPNEAKIGALIRHLGDMGREDAVKSLLSTTPPYITSS
ncbi:unnamed protein product [Darwinula stevensoni]|uniref:Non-specific serine/threonine protein kinase n=1 Tax=Darwinula stevensoni TaxID=69355 RepID=A0A7R8XB50_9CRUS|nr:unnamed protein product [Darwinula stevensoni]CAG0890672.1 unnamed protein product [Darwinula stevensoni]